jgi:hypothetical protein
MADAARDGGSQAPSATHASTTITGAPAFVGPFAFPPAFFLNDRGADAGDSGVPQLTLHVCCAHEEALLFGAVSSMVFSKHIALVCAPDVPGGRSLGAHLKTAREGGILIGHPYNDARNAATAKTQAMAKALSTNLPTRRIWTACAPALAPRQTHHTKLLLLCYERFLRFCLLSGNLCAIDWRDNTNSIYVQDFPRKAASSAAGPSEFEAALLRYFQELSSKGGCNVAKLVRHLKEYDYASVKVTLLASAPGARDADARFGHLGLRAALREEAAFAAAAAQPAVATELVAQCSSYGSLTQFQTLSPAARAPPRPTPSRRRRAARSARAPAAPLTAAARS